MATLGQMAVLPVVWLALGAAAVLAAWLALRRGWLPVAAGLALLAWALAGALAASGERRAIPADRADRLVAAGRLDLSEPLRWHGRLREDPRPTPWGVRYLLDLESVQQAGRWLAVQGGMRLESYRRPPPGTPAATVRAGDRVEVLTRARLPRNFLDPGAADRRGMLERAGIVLTGTLRSPELLEPLPSAPPGWQARLARLRGRWLDRLDHLATPEHAPLLRAMLLGDRNFLDWSLAEDFQKAAVYHVLVLAGLHVAVLAAFFFWLGRLLRWPEWVVVVLTLVALAAYVAIVEQRPPILRAATMAALVLVARLLYRRLELLNVVALAAVVLLLAQPSMLADVGFQLSFLAVGVIAAIALPLFRLITEPRRAVLTGLLDASRDRQFPPRRTQLRLELRALALGLATRLHLAPERVAAALSATGSGLLVLVELALLSLVLQWGLLPVLVAQFHRVSLSGPLANIPAVLLTAILVPLGFLALAGGALLPGLARLLAPLLDGAAALLVGIVRWFARWPQLSYRIPAPPAWLTVLFLVLLVLLAVLLREPRRRRPRWLLLILVPLLVATVAIATCPFPPRLFPNRLEVTVLDVGQGDAIFVAFPDGHTLLMDAGGLSGSFLEQGYRAGPDVGEEVVSQFLWWRRIRRLDVVALTHAHHDHMGGLPAVLDNFRVGALWVGRDAAIAAFDDLLREAAARGVPVEHRHRGDQFQWGGVAGEFLWPDTLAPVRRPSNDDSLVLRLQWGAARLLLPGDIERRTENRLVADDGAELAADFLKVPHHGSRTSSTAPFLEQVHPRWAVVSAGADNPYGHPAAEVLERYRQLGIAVWRTDRDGAVTAVTDGRRFALAAFTSAVPLLH